MKMIKYILFSVSAFLAASCSLLDTEPQDFIDPNDYYATEGQLHAALNGVYATMAQTGLYGAAMLAGMGLSADIVRAAIR